MRRVSQLAAPLVLLLLIVLRWSDPPLLQSQRYATFDEYQRYSTTPWTDVGVRIIDVDEASLARIGQWPWPRTRIAEMLTKLGALGTRVVAFDVIFAEPDRTSPHRMLADLPQSGEFEPLRRVVATLPDHDEVFADVLSRVPAVLGFAFNDEETARRPERKRGFAVVGDPIDQFVVHKFGAAVNLPAFEKSAAGLGSVTAEPDRDGINRRAPLLFAFRRPAGGADIYPSLGLEALGVAENARTFIVRTSNSQRSERLGAKTGIVEVKVGRHLIPTDHRGEFWIKDTGPIDKRVIPAWTILSGTQPPDALKNMIVFVGSSAVGLKDLRAMPLNKAAAGVEVHVRFVEQVLQGDFLERPDLADYIEILWVAVLGTVLIVLIPRVGPIWCAGIGIVSLAASIVMSWFAYAKFNLLFDPIFPSAAILMLYLVASMLIFMRTELERRRTRNVLMRYVPPGVATRMAANPDRLKLGGETRDMTIMFSDIRGFTTRSEKMSAEQLTRFINRFLTPMTTVIQEHDGTIDKYMGDAIMAFWNAPQDVQAHPRVAADAALGMIAALEALNRELETEAKATGQGFEPVAIGIGINTGTVSVGNMGSEQRFDYSVIGDDVNLASRLEGRSKSYGVVIVLGERTASRLGEDYAVLELDRLRVKGKTKPVTIFTLLGGAEIARSTWFTTLRENHDAMLRHYRGCEWDAAESACAEAGRHAGGRLDAYYELYAERIADFRVTPPPSDWDGVEIATEK